MGDEIDGAAEALGIVATATGHPEAALMIKLANKGRQYLGIRTAADNLRAGILAEHAETFSNDADGWKIWQPYYESRPEAERPTFSDVGAVLSEARRVAANTADPSKRRLLHNAIVNSFDPEQYKLGMHRRLFRVLEEVEYGDVVLLREMYERHKTSFEPDVASLKAYEGQSRHHHLVELIRAGLVLHISHTKNGTAATPQPNDRIRVSYLGERLVFFLREPPEAG